MDKGLVRKGGKGGHSRVARAEGEATPEDTGAGGGGGRRQKGGSRSWAWEVSQSRQGALCSEHAQPDDRRASWPPHNPTDCPCQLGVRRRVPAGGSAWGADGLAVSGLTSRVGARQVNASRGPCTTPNVLLVYFLVSPLVSYLRNLGF